MPGSAESLMHPGLVQTQTGHQTASLAWPKSSGEAEDTTIRNPVINTVSESSLLQGEVVT